MSSALPTLNKLRKPELVEIAERTNLSNFSDLNKGDLAISLDKHLSDNRNTFSHDKKLSDYYKKLDNPSRGYSPVKRETKVELSEKKTPGRKSTRRDPVSSESEDAAKSPIKTPTTNPKSSTPATATASASASAVRSSSRAVRSVFESTTQQLPPSPAIVTDAIDRQTTRMREGLETAWSDSGVLEYQHALRSFLSNLKVVEAIIVSLEGGNILWSFVPWKYLTTTPAIEGLHIPPLAIKVPDLFVLLSATFWAPFSLWLVTGLVLPLVAAYFINLSWQAATGTRRTRSVAGNTGRASFDPLTFNIAKALIVYKVFVDGFTFFDVFDNFTVASVNAAVPGHSGGMLTGTAIGVVGTLYEAILRHH